MKTNQIRNELDTESSPYLKQHKDNPVHWQPWGEEAFNLAKESKKPIMLSIGYASCHWCHVMAHESFENIDTAELMNNLYINIKVDREERPDVDSIYMTALAMMGQQGGWPLTMFLTPDGKPYWGGTYFPPTSRYGHPGFSDVLKAVSSLYHDQRDKVAANIEAILDGLAQQAKINPIINPNSQTMTEIDLTAEQSLSMIDFQNGGMTGAPKFPQPSFQEFLWRAYLRTNNKNFSDAVITSLTHMCQGGIYDHLGGGFARYSTDALWLTPHFEKMLYDNAQLIHLMTLVWQKTNLPLLKQRVRETIEWVLRELTLKAGGFAGTLDADSPDKEGHSQEGAFYVWDEIEIRRLLGNEFNMFKKFYDVSEEGNWEQKNILNRLRTIDLSDKHTENELTRCRELLFREREHRTRPGLDDKVLADWNGLMIGALSYAGVVFEEEVWIGAAKDAYEFIQKNLTAEKRLKHSYCSGSSKETDVLDDYACMIKGSLFLFQATGTQEYLSQAISWTQTADKYFWDQNGAGYFDSPSDAIGLIARTKTVFDNATPSGNGVMAENLARLYYLTGNQNYRHRAEILITSSATKTPNQGANMPSMMAGFEILENGLQVIIIAKNQDGDDLTKAAFSIGNPNLIHTKLSPNTKLPKNHPAFGKSQIEDQPTAYVCKGQTCSPPHTKASELIKDLAL